ncbi:hypothetical protein [Propioniciclava soli]|uniref:hypothetical protein n=1 Tax=Propioniciclava soli TaxID=2775081 RepID=UPI001E48553A|nr:hypothetical protein [Propioniciclava soli]
MADALAARLAARVAAWVVCGALVVVVLASGIGVAAGVRETAAGVVVGLVLLAAVAVVAWRLGRRAAADPVPSRVRPSDTWGMGSDRATRTSWAAVTLIFGGLLALMGPQLPPSALLATALLGLVILALLVATGLPGILIRRHKWQLLDDALRAHPAEARQFEEEQRRRGEAPR